MPVNVDSYYTGVLPAGVIIPMTGPTGVLPAKKITAQGAILPPAKLSPGTLTLPHTPMGIPDNGEFPLVNVARQVQDRIKSNVFPPVGQGDGLISELCAKVRSLDPINGMDRVLGKTKYVASFSRARRKYVKIDSALTSKEVHGRLSGKLPGQPLGRQMDVLA